MNLIDNEHQLPVGLGMRLALDMKAMTNFASMQEQSKKQLVDYIEGSTTGDEAKNRVLIVSSLFAP